MFIALIWPLFGLNRAIIDSGSVAIDQMAVFTVIGNFFLI